MSYREKKGKKKNNRKKGKKKKKTFEGCWPRDFVHAQL